jgi:hypothetical protein
MPFNIELIKPTVLVIFSGGLDSLGVSDKFIQCGGCSSCKQMNGIQRAV